jgi:NodT family efflux transporter outer membrane factor (OMF) lipoprotein
MTSIEFPSRLLITATIMLAVSGCAGLTGAPALEHLRSLPSLASAQSLKAPAGSFPSTTWWDSFSDPGLSSLIEEALKGSPDLKSASARLRVADAMILQTESSTSPSVSASAEIGGEKQSKNQGFPPQFIPGGILGTGRLVAKANYDLDLWGKNRAALVAATSEAAAARADLARVQLSLASAIAETYVDLARLHAQHDVATLGLRINSETAALTVARVQEGLDTKGDVYQAAARQSSSRVQIGQIDELITLKRHQLAALIGAGPDRGLTIPRPRLVASKQWGTPESLALDLLGRRPDLASARLRAEAAAARIKMARADFYPNINLSAVAGLQSIGLDKLFQSGSSMTRFGPAISLPLFDRKNIKGRYLGAHAAYDESTAQYEATLIAAMREVADAVAGKQAIAATLADAESAAAAARNAHDIMKLRFGQGLANRLQLLAAEDGTIAAQSKVTELKLHNISLDLALIHALGGGFSSAKLATGPSQ